MFLAYWIIYAKLGFTPQLIRHQNKQWWIPNKFSHSTKQWEILFSWMLTIWLETKFFTPPYFSCFSNLIDLAWIAQMQWLQTLLSPGKKFKTRTSRHAYAIEYPEPLVHFALSSGAHSDPAVKHSLDVALPLLAFMFFPHLEILQSMLLIIVKTFGWFGLQIRIYSAKSIFQDLNVAKEEFIQATVYVHKQNKINLPKILHYYAKDMSLGMAALLKVVSECLPGIQQKAINRFSKGRPEKCIHWLEESSSFRYLIHKEMAETT